MSDNLDCLTFGSEIVPCLLFSELFTDTSLVYECITTIDELTPVTFLKQGSTAFPVLPLEEAKAERTIGPSTILELQLKPR